MLIVLAHVSRKLLEMRCCHKTLPPLPCARQLLPKTSLTARASSWDTSMSRTSPGRRPLASFASTQVFKAVSALFAADPVGKNKASRPRRYFAISAFPLRQATCRAVSPLLFLWAKSARCADKRSSTAAVPRCSQADSNAVLPLRSGESGEATRKLSTCRLLSGRRSVGRGHPPVGVGRKRHIYLVCKSEDVQDLLYVAPS